MPETKVDDWTDDELRAAIRTYFQMLELELREEPYVKAEFKRRLIIEHLPRRTEGAVEFRMENITEVLQNLRQPWIEGYKPKDHVGVLVEERIRKIIQDERSQERPQNLTFGDVCPSLEQVQGVKAVFGPISSYVLCFGGRGAPNSTRFYYQAANAARSAVDRPFIIAIGGGAEVGPGSDGRVVSLARTGTVFGPTNLLLQDEDEIKRLDRWPVSVSLSEVWHFEGKPHLVDDLGLPDKTVLAGSQDGIVRPLEKISALWESLRRWPIRLAALPPQANFYDSGKPQRAMTKLPFIAQKQMAEEGEKAWRYQSEAERDAGLRAAVKRANFERYGNFTCEACEYANRDVGMFDAHHTTPLFIGKRITLAEHLIVLCPTCHRRAHRTRDKLRPLSLSELRSWVAEGKH